MYDTARRSETARQTELLTILNSINMTTRIDIIEEIFKLYDSGHLFGKAFKISYNGATHLVYNFTDFGGVRKFSRNILKCGLPYVRNQECQVTGMMTDYLQVLLQCIKSKSFVDLNLF